MLGRLKKITDLRYIWETEDRDFTPWLAEEENLQILADTIGIDLELEAVEESVGPFRADILCKDTQNDNWVLIENQLEKTDHRHLGQLMTYAAGLQAVTIVWIADRFSEEHRAAMDWLNKITGDAFRFFGLEIELWRIDDSNPAPKFNIIAKPNDWSRLVSKASNTINEELNTPLKKIRLEYWACLQKFLKEQNSFINFPNPRPKQWCSLSIGRTGFTIHTTIHSSKNRMGVELYISGENAKSYFHLLLNEKESIENEIGYTLEWNELPDRIGSRIIIFEKGHLNSKNKWSRDMAWFKEMLEKFDTCFRSRVKNLDIDDLEHELEAAE